MTRALRRNTLSRLYNKAEAHRVVEEVQRVARHVTQLAPTVHQPFFRHDSFGDPPRPVRRWIHDSPVAAQRRHRARERGLSAVYAEGTGPKIPGTLRQPHDVRVRSSARLGWWGTLSRWWQSLGAGPQRRAVSAATRDS